MATEKTEPTTARISARTAMFAALGALVVLIILQVSGWSDFEDSINTTTLGLVLLALVLLFALVSPQAMRDLVERLTTIKLPGGVEIGLQALSRAERSQARLPESTDDVEVEERPRSGDAVQDYRYVRDKLEKRLRFVRDAIFELPDELDYPDIVERIEREKLLEADELALVNDLLGRVEDEVDKWPAALREEYFDVSWRFASRFATLVFERLVRKRMAEAGWFLADFQQDPKHRPDFLAYRDRLWLRVAARVMPTKLGGTRQRLARERPPFEPVPVAVIPDSRTFEADGKYANVKVFQLGELLERQPSDRI